MVPVHVYVQVGDGPIAKVGTAELDNPDTAAADTALFMRTMADEFETPIGTPPSEEPTPTEGDVPTPPPTEVPGPRP